MCPKERKELRSCDLVPSTHLRTIHLGTLHRARPKVAIKLWQPVDKDRDDDRAAPNVADTPLAKPVAPKIPLLAMESENTSLFFLLDTEFAQVLLQAADRHQPPEVSAMRIALTLSVVQLDRSVQHFGIAVCSLVVVS